MSGHTYSDCLLHIVFATKERRSFPLEQMQHPATAFAWQEGFAAFTVSRSQIDTIESYIRNQEQHHAKRDFAAEFVALLKKHGVDYDPRYVLG